MKCAMCKYVNAAREAERHPNSLTIFTANALRRKVLSGNLCDAHKQGEARSMGDADKTMASVTSNGYVPLEHVWHIPIWVPKGDRQ